MKELDDAIKAYRWVCGSEGSTPGPDTLAATAAISSTEVAKQVCSRLLPIVAEINTERDIRAFLARVIVHDGIGMNFNPDASFDSYMSEYGVPGTMGYGLKNMYDDGEAETNDFLLAACKEFLGARRAFIFNMASELIVAMTLPEL